MSSFNRHPFAPYVLAAALQAACAAWPCAVFAQSAASSGSSANASGQRSQGDTLSTAAQRQKLDEQRLLGGPGTSDNPYSVTPYSSNGASPDDARDALTNETHMHVVTPGDYAASEASASGGRGGSSSRIGANGRSRAGNAASRNSAGAAAGGHRSSAGYDYGARETSPTAQVYGNPYSNPYGSPTQANSELYKSPW